jgi:hypothetical protein
MLIESALHTAELVEANNCIIIVLISIQVCNNVVTMYTVPNNFTCKFDTFLMRVS